MVAAETVVAAVRAHADRVHDLARRLGCNPSAAAEVTEASALELVDAAAATPHEVADPVGWWFRRAEELARAVSGGVPAARQPRPMGETRPFVGLVGQGVLTRALAELPDEERLLLLLRDSYDLAPSTVAAASGRTPDAVSLMVARGRLELLDSCGEAVPEPTGHVGELGPLARVAEGSVAPRDVAVARHVGRCAGCTAVVDAQTRARRLMAGLVVVALVDADRDTVLRRTRQRAGDLLPTRAAIDEARAAVLAEEPPEPPPLVSGLLVLALLLLGLVVGVVAGVLTA